MILMKIIKDVSRLDEKTDEKMDKRKRKKRRNSKKRYYRRIDGGTTAPSLKTPHHRNYRRVGDLSG